MHQPPCDTRQRWLRPGEQGACEAVLRSVPEWFGIESSLQNYVAKAAELPTVVAEVGIGLTPGSPDTAGSIVGFLTIAQHFPESGEVYCLAVRREFHRGGIGRALVGFAANWLASRGARWLQVKTMGPSKPNAEYAQTLRFYRACGFDPLEEIHGLWGTIPCLVLVKRIGS
ncbi:MAG: GNAT family N-acetyltransferase [Phycisphaerales bacterium]|nr:GNAT family N-acetyltransferase [Phycisphaerales bacterium]